MPPVVIFFFNTIVHQISYKLLTFLSLLVWNFWANFNRRNIFKLIEKHKTHFYFTKLRWVMELFFKFDIQLQFRTRKISNALFLFREIQKEKVKVIKRSWDEAFNSLISFFFNKLSLILGRKIRLTLNHKLCKNISFIRLDNWFT